MYLIAMGLTYHIYLFVVLLVDINTEVAEIIYLYDVVVDR